MSKHTATTICDMLGRDEIARALGVAHKTVIEAERKGVLPAFWWAAMSDLHGAPLPTEMFSFKRAAEPTEAA